MYPSIYNSFAIIRTTIAKNRNFYVPRPSFLLPWGRPCGNHAKRCMNEKTIQCLPNPSQHVPIYLQQFPSYSNRKCKSPLSRTAAHIFVSPGDAPAIITQYVAWMESQFNACQTPCSMYLSIFKSYTMLKSMRKSKNRYFYHIFVSPRDAPGAITLNVVWMEREFDAYKLSCCMCPSNYNRFWDRARYWSKIVIFSYPVEIVRYWKTRMAWLPKSEKISKIRLFVSTELTKVTDGQTHRQTDTAWRHGPRLCIASRGKNGGRW